MSQPAAYPCCQGEAAVPGAPEAPVTPGAPCQLCEAKVFSVLDDMFLITGPAGLLRARRAASCLLVPCAGDTVLVSISPARCHILAVLETQEENGTVQLPKRCAVQASDLSLEAESRLRLHAPGLEADARHISLRATLCRLCGLRLEQRFDAVHTRAGHLLAMAGRALSFFGRRLEKVDGLCETEAGRMRLSSEESLRVRADSLDMRSTKGVVLDGEHINIG